MDPNNIVLIDHEKAKAEMEFLVAVSVHKLESSQLEAKD
jgi:hypothetical protein